MKSSQTPPLRARIGCRRVSQSIEVADHADDIGIRRPHREANPRHALAVDQVRAHRVVALVVRAFAVKVEVEIGQQGREAVRVFDVLRRAHPVCDPQLVFA